jgi:hypothetical protein
VDIVRVDRGSFDGQTASATLHISGRAYPVAIRSRTTLRPPQALGDVWLPLALFPAMRTGAALELADPVSHQLLRSLPTIQGILSTWYPELTTVPVRASGRRRRRWARQPHVAQLFTGGVDSFFTMRRRPQVRTLLYAHDALHDTEAVRERISPLLRSAADDAGKRLVEVDSDVRSMLDNFGEWGAQTHGATLAAFGALLSGSVTELLIPASHTYLELDPWGSHPMLDHLWSSEALSVVHDSADVGRSDKIRALASDPTALSHLRVCWQAVDDINCSRCEKCIRTMTTLDVLGALDRATTFAGPLSLDAVRSVAPRNVSDLAFSRDNLVAARAAGRHDVADAIAESMAGYDRPRSGTSDVAATAHPGARPQEHS